MNRPSKYSNFDPDCDFMHVVDLKREEEIKGQIRQIQTSADPVTRSRNVQSLQDELHLCRIRVKVEGFDNNMREIGIQLAERIHETLTRIQNRNQLKTFQTQMNGLAFDSYKQRGFPEFIENDFDEIISRVADGEKGRFLRNCGTIYFATLQKYIPMRMGELP